MKKTLVLAVAAMFLCVGCGLGTPSSPDVTVIVGDSNSTDNDTDNDTETTTTTDNSSTPESTVTE